MVLKEKIAAKKAGIVTYGMTPPKASHPPEKLAEIARKQVERLKVLDMDALLLYDVQEEADRVEKERPFPYLPTVDPASYSEQYLGELSVPTIIYRCVGNDTEIKFADWVKRYSDRERFSVYVGASSGKQRVNLDLPEAYRISKQMNPHLAFGGVVIPERHMNKKDEHIRVVDKIKNGCGFFVTQAAYNVEATKNFLSDYYFYCSDLGAEMVPILVNLAPCGSAKTLEFMKWLGISIPAWLENELTFTHNVLDKSIKLLKDIFEEIADFGLEKGIPIGCSVESVSSRKEEIEASVQLIRDVKSIFDKKLKSAAVVS